MRVEAVELFALEMPLCEPFETSFGRVAHREMVLVALRSEGLTGWGEVSVARRPHYSAETTETAWHCLRDFLVPAIVGREFEGAADLLAAFAWVRGHHMARAGLEAAFLDLLAMRAGLPLWRFLGAVEGRPVAVGVSVGLQDGGVPALLDRVARYLEQGYARVKVKIAPGRDLDLVRACRERFPAATLAADGNGAYSGFHGALFEEMDRYGLAFIEQPGPPDDVVEHARLQRAIRTPICLDESVPSPNALRSALALDACKVLNVKMGRLGGVTAALECLKISRKAGIDAWVGGMLETGVGRAHNLALAAQPGFSMPGDLSASDRYYLEDLVDPPFRLGPGGTLAPPLGPGIGVEVVRARVEARSVRREQIRA